MYKTKIVCFLMICIITILSMGCFETSVYADKKQNGVNNFKVSMDSKGNVSVSGTSNKNTWNQIFEKYKKVIVGVTGIATLTLLLVFIISIVNLAANGSNPQKRSMALTWILWTGIATGLLGSVTIIFGIAYNAFS